MHRKVRVSSISGRGVALGVAMAVAATVALAWPALALAAPFSSWVTLTARASVDAAGNQGLDTNENYDGSSNPAISSGGRYVLFYSKCSFVTTDTNVGEGPIGDWYLKDTTSGAVELVSIWSDGSQADAGARTDAMGDVSADGRKVVFDTDAKLVADDDNDASDVYYRNLDTGVTSRVSVDAAGAQGLGVDSNRYESWGSSISDDGASVAFESRNWFVPADTSGNSDIYVKNTTDDSSIECASAGLGGATANGDSLHCDISADGRFVAFASQASNLIAGDTNDATDVFVYDRQNPTQTTRVSVGLEGAQPDGQSAWPSISADGRYVAFQSFASNLVEGDTNGQYDVFVFDRVTGKTKRASVGLGGEPNAECERPSISADGRYVAFYSEASNLVADDTNEKQDVFVRDLVGNRTTMVSVSTEHELGDDRSGAPSISGSGLKVAYESDASNLVLNDTNGYNDIFVSTLAPPVDTVTELPRSGTSVGRPWTRWSVRRNSRALVYGYLSTWHKRGTSPVTLNCYRLENGVWVLRKTAAVKAGASTRSRRTKYAGYVRLPLKGRWKIVAEHAHPGYQVDSSAPRYFWVR
jgi:hypothetical protein